MEKVKLASPWISYARKIRAFFANDPSVNVQYNADNNEIILRVEGTAKADALTQLLPTEKEFGNVTVKITIIPANKFNSSRNLLIDALTGNDAFYGIVEAPEDSWALPAVYVVFDDEVIQYPNDDLSHYCGVETTLFEDLARDIFENVDDNIFFNTMYDNDNDLHSDVPSGVWPIGELGR